MAPLAVACVAAHPMAARSPAGVYVGGQIVITEITETSAVFLK
jgi:hypothetical protein